MPEFGIVGFSNSSKVSCKCQNLALPDLLIQAKCLATVNAGFVNAGFLVFSARCFATSVNAEFVNIEFGNARFGNCGKVCCHCECWMCECRILLIFKQGVLPPL
jgi:hypothetical protein